MKSIISLIVFSTVSLAPADTTFDNISKYAWGANTGWISFRHDRPASPAGVVVAATHLSGFAWSANTGWIYFGSGSPANGHTYSNTGSDHGVNNDPDGNLSGFAWSANTGWINFGWADASDDDRPRVDLTTGEFSGYAWSANTGWINLGTGLLATQSIEGGGTIIGSASASILQIHSITPVAGNQREIVLRLTPPGSGAPNPTLYQSTDLGLTDPWTPVPAASFTPVPGEPGTYESLLTRPDSIPRLFFRVAIQP